MKLSTFVFMLRWQFIPFASGCLISLLSAYFLSIYKDDPPDAPFLSIMEMIGIQGGVLGLLIGFCMLGWAWGKAAKLSGGR